MTKPKNTQSLINTLNYMITTTDHPEKIISTIISEQRPDEMLISEFYKYLTPESFVSAYRTTDKVRALYPELFNEKLYLQGLSNTLNYRTRVNEFNDNLKQASIHALVQSILQQKDINLEKPKADKFTIPVKNMTLSDIYKYKDKLHLSEDNIKDIINHAYSDEFTAENVANIIGISNSIDELLFNNIKNDALLVNDVMKILIEKHPENLSSVVMPYLSKEKRDEIIYKWKIDAGVFVKAICRLDNLGEKLQYINDVYSGKNKLKKTATTFDSDLSRLLYCLPESEICKFVKFFSKLAPRAFSYKVMSFLLKEKELNESELISVYHFFKTAGLSNDVREYAKRFGYEKLMKLE